MSQYPGPDPDDPFAKKPNEDAAPPAPPVGSGSGTEETAPIQRDEVGYWEKLAQDQAAQSAQSGQSGQQPPAAPSYQQNPTSAQPIDQPINQSVESNPWAGYGEAAQPGSTPPPPPPPTTPYGTAPAYGAAPAYGYGAPGQPYYAQPAPPNDGLGVASLVVGITSFVLACLYGIGLLGSPVAMVMGRIAMKRIDRSEGQIGGRGMAQAGFVMGIIGTVLLVLFIIVIAVIVVVAVNGGFDGSSYSDTEF